MLLKAEFDRPQERKYTPEYQAFRNRLSVLKRRINKTTGEERQQWINEHKKIRAEMLKTPSKSQTDKKIKYMRYADDFIIGVSGSHDDCQLIKDKFTKFISSMLKMELSKSEVTVTNVLTKLLRLSQLTGGFIW